jgi:hypothetical protein
MKRLKVDRVMAAQLRGDIVCDVPASRTCEDCGCSDLDACKGGCTWVSDDPVLCSACTLAPSGGA